MDCILPKYRPSKEEFDEIWEKCIFIPDTSLLLGLFRYSHDIRKSIINVFEKVPDRLWIPHQVALEYHENWENVIDDEINKYNDISNIINECCREISNKLKKRDLFRRFEATSENTNSLVEKINKYTKKELNDAKQYYPQKDSLNEVHKKIISLFFGKVGVPYSLEKLVEIQKMGSLRYELKLPPGYEDNGKGGIKSYGDLIIWFQIIDFAKEEKKPIILILDDLKEDWWWKPSNKIIGPRPELISEFTSKLKMQFYMYSMDQFLKYAKEYIDKEINKKVIEEAQEYRDEEEKRLTEIRFENLASILAEDANKMQVALANIPKISEAYRLQHEHIAKILSMAYGVNLPKSADFSSIEKAAKMQSEQIAKSLSMAYDVNLLKSADFSSIEKAAKMQSEQITKSLSKDCSVNLPKSANEVKVVEEESQQSEKLVENSESPEIPQNQPTEMLEEIRKKKNDVQDTLKKDTE